MAGTSFAATSTSPRKSLEIVAEAKNSKNGFSTSCAMRSQNDNNWRDFPSTPVPMERRFPTSFAAPYNSRMAKHPDVAIVGGGIIGLTCAYFLAKEGLSVEVFDRGDLGKEASWAGAGIIPPGNPAGAATPIDRLRAIGSARSPASRKNSATSPASITATSDVVESSSSRTTRRKSLISGMRRGSSSIAFLTSPRNPASADRRHSWRAIFAARLCPGPKPPAPAALIAACERVGVRAEPA